MKYAYNFTLFYLGIKTTTHGFGTNLEGDEDGKLHINVTISTHAIIICVCIYLLAMWAAMAELGKHFRAKGYKSVMISLKISTNSHYSSLGPKIESVTTLLQSGSD